MSKYRGWCFTVCNYTEEELESIKTIPCRYLVVGREVASTGTPHLQGYIYFEHPRCLAGVSRAIPRAHLEVARGTAAQNLAYCTKQDAEPYVRGDPPRCKEQRVAAGKEAWQEVIQFAKADDMDSLYEHHPAAYVTHYRTLKAIASDNQEPPPTLDNVCGEWYWGEAGVGKTTFARMQHPNAYIKGRHRWWDNYKGEEVVIMDDMDPFHKGMGGLIKDWTDRFPFRAEIKGSSMLIRPRKVIITSQYPPERIWEDAETLAAVRRRCKVLKFSKPFGNSPPEIEDDALPPSHSNQEAALYAPCSEDDLSVY